MQNPRWRVTQRGYKSAREFALTRYSRVGGLVPPTAGDSKVGGFYSQGPSLSVVGLTERTATPGDRVGPSGGGQVGESAEGHRRTTPRPAVAATGHGKRAPTTARCPSQRAGGHRDEGRKRGQELHG